MNARGNAWKQADSGADLDSDESLFELRAVTAGYGGTTVLRDVSLKVRKGTVTALLGPNGAGKTTTLSTAAGLVRPTSGQVLLNGRDVTDAPPHRHTAFGLCLIPEGRGVFRSLTVRENLRLQLGSHGRTSDVFEPALTIFPALRDRMGEVAGRLSGGQQQMLALARAYITRPQVILLDEVSMGLAPLVVDEIFAALDQLAKTGIAMLLVEQYVTRALAMADTVVLLNKGIVAYAGPPHGLDEGAVLRGYLGAEFEATTPLKP